MTASGPDRLPPTKSGLGTWTWVLAGLAALVLGLTLLRMVVSWENLSRIDHVSGAWLTLSTDLRDGLFYRPLFDPATGYGGTRFFPLYFILHALFMGFWPSPFTSGAILASATGVFYLAGMMFLSRRMGLSAGMSVICAFLSLAGLTLQYALTTIRGDLLPATLTIWGVALALDDTRRGDAWAAACFSLAFAAKVTSVHGIAAVVLWRALSGRWRTAVRIGGITAAGYALFLTLLGIASEGRIWEIIRTCSSGGATAGTILKSPWTLAVKMLEGDLPCLFFCLLALARLFSLDPSRWREPVPIFFCCATAVTVFIFGSPGILITHLADLHMAAWIVIGHALGSPTPPKASFRSAPLVALMVVISLVPMIDTLRYEDKRNPHRRFLEDIARTLHAETRRNDGPILSEDPVVPLVSGGDPIFLQDAFMFARLIQARPEEETRLADMITRREFRAIVLSRDPDAIHPGWYQRHFSPSIIQRIRERYRPISRLGGYVVFLPSGDETVH